MGQDVELLERQAEIAEARLGVAEELGGIAALLAATSVVLAWGSWLIAIAVGVISYIGMTTPYLRAESKATDAYHRAVGLGDYVHRNTRAGTGIGEA